jgi:FlaA1/EpsC-like NDP-sugar epimerase
MFASKSTIATSTRAARFFYRNSHDVKHRHTTITPTSSVFFSTCSTTSPLSLQNKIPRTTIQAQTSHLQNRHQQPYRNMSNNADLQLNQVFNVKDKVALVTGGGSGIGLMITQTLAVNGAKVYIVGRTEEKLERVVEHHGKDIAGQYVIPGQKNRLSFC